LATHFILLVQNKVGKQKDTPLPLFPSVLAPHLGGGGTRLLTSFRLKQSSPLSICRINRKGHVRQVPAVSQRPWRQTLRRGKGI
jgi:hypothetical protein